MSGPCGRASGEPAPRGPAHLPGSRRFGRVREPLAYPGHGGEGHGVDGGPVDGLGEVGEEGRDGPRGVGDLFGEGFEADDLMGLGGARGPELGGSGEVVPDPGVDEVRGDP